MDSTASYWTGFNKALALTDDKFRKMNEELKALEEKLDRTEKQRNALIIALNYLNDTINSMIECSIYNPKYTKRFYKKSIRMMREVMNNALIMAADNSEGAIKLEVKEDDN